MIRRIRHLHFPASWLATAAARQLDPPSRAPDSRLASYGTRRQSGDPPSGCGRIRQSAFAHRLSAIAPASQEKGSGAGVFRGKLQAAARNCAKRPDFADDCDNAGSVQPLLHCPQDLGIARRPNQYDPAGIEPVGGEARPVKIRAGQTPQHDTIRGPGEPSEDVGGKGGSERAILLVATSSEDFVQGAPREPAARQCPIDCRDAKRQDTMRPCRWPFDPPDAFAELGEKRVFRAGPGTLCRPIGRDELAQRPLVLLRKIPLLQRIP
jgi:hypothetical protein